ncbi:MAG: T9SS type A sorting domain-containing protein [Bacteroidetes bacterium]|nr:T9SS type A sorting domain-containing protein [Bacteroidota bacterium]
MKRLNQIFLLLSIFIITVGFNFRDNPPSNWYQQFLNIGARQISDMTFVDSLTGYAITPYVTQNDTAFVFKTTNGGDNWFIAHKATGEFVGMNKIKFFNQSTGYCCGVGLYNNSTGLNRTINGGLNWTSLNVPDPFLVYQDMCVLNEDTIWLTGSDSFSGGVFRTTNGGLNWTQQLNLGGTNPEHIHMINGRTGFISNTSSSPYVMRTTNSGLNWTTVVSNEGFTDMHFVDSLTGWRAYGLMKKTTNGGLDWITQPLPSQTGLSQITKFSVLNKDTIWGVNGYYVYPNNEGRGVLYTTTNGGANWYFQVPDTNLKIFRYNYVQFTDKNHGWAYNLQTGIHTTLGGDPITAINPISLQTPSDYRLYQNYPNPFNPSTVISYQFSVAGFITIKVYNISGKEITTLINQRQPIGTYSISFDANKYNLSSGIYFYSFQTGNFKETKKMMLIK